jgi:hypothetical protein
MKIKKEQLRQGAQAALAEKGFSGIELVSGPGIVPGARLRAVRDGKSWDIAVRTSSDREVGLLRTPTGTWRTVSRVDLVLVAVPANDALAVDVLAFAPETLRQVFSATVEVSEKNNKDKSRFKNPVFVPLDDVRNSRTKKVRPGIGIEAAWQVQIPLGRLSTRSSALGNEDYRARFYEDIKKQIADFVGVDVSKIVLEIRINP